MYVPSPDKDFKVLVKDLIRYDQPGIIPHKTITMNKSRPVREGSFLLLR